MTALKREAPALDPTSPFTRQEALRSALSDADLRKRRYQRVFHGVYVSSATRMTPAVRATAALRISTVGA